jgi:hypothetical protein
MELSQSSTTLLGAMTWWADPAVKTVEVLSGAVTRFSQPGTSISTCTKTKQNMVHSMLVGMRVLRVTMGSVGTYRVRQPLGGMR